MQTHLEIASSNGAFRIDSRVLAMQLGYEHKVVLQSIRRHRARLETRSALLHFEAVLKHEGYQGSTRQTYYLLDERQCLILPGSLKKGKEADEWHDRLVDAFLQARERARQLEKQQSQQAPQPCINSLWEKRALLFNQRTHIPARYWLRVQ